MNIETITKTLQEAITSKQAEITGLTEKQLELRSLQASLAALQRTSASGDAKKALPRKKSGESIRMCVLRILKDNADTPLAPKQIAAMLVDKGYVEKTDALANNLGATLSVMINQREEIKRKKVGDTQGYVIAAKGLKQLEVV